MSTVFWKLVDKFVFLFFLVKKDVFELAAIDQSNWEY